MKKIALLFLASGLLGTSAFAQTINVPTDHKTILMKFTADWCGPCGSGGWTMMNGFVSDANSGSLHAIPVAFHTSSSTTTTLNVGNTNWGAMDGNLDTKVTGIPSFVVGRKNMAQSSSGVTNEVSSATSGAAEANAGFIATYDAANKKIDVQTKVKFFGNATGDYYLAVYLYEDNIHAYQNGSAAGGSNAIHNHVLRIPANPGIWGKKIPAGPYTATSEFSDNFIINMQTGWDINEMHVFTVIWKKTGSTYEVVNANKVGTFPTSVASIENVANLRVYPNPAGSFIHVAADLRTANTPTSVTITNMIGQNVYSNTFTPSSTDFDQTINTSDLINGVYFVNVTIDNKTTTQRVLISK